MRIVENVVGFEWDDGNRHKSLMKHGVTTAECEEVFEDDSKVVREDTVHSHAEARHYLIGRTRSGRVLFVSFTIRKDLIRIISARPINKKERHLYE